MIATFLVNESDTAAKIGTQTDRTFSIVQDNGVPEIETDGQQAFSKDRKTVQSTIIETFENIAVTYVFPLDELNLDDEFRLSTNGYDDEVTLDMTEYPWINRVLQVQIYMEPKITTQVLGCGTKFRRSFRALVVG